MLKRPTDVKKFWQSLKLNQYDDLEERAKDCRAFKAVRRSS